ncbi:hypothetical protein [Paenibacillus periandrae]|nr:hypothetical protein [Paenibacillus periandrae]
MQILDSQGTDMPGFSARIGPASDRLSLARVAADWANTACRPGRGRGL